VHRDGVANVLEDVRAEAEAEMRKLLVERSKFVDLYTEVEIDHLSRLCGTLAKRAAANGIGESFQLGINRSVTAEELEQITAQVPKPVDSK
jgi:predicted metal-dependent TIM-barrel fold hydrolase